MMMLTSAHAASIMPDFSTAPTGWETDRYQPDFFGNIGTFEGRNNVLQIGITDDDSSQNRPVGQQGAFYNTQGMKYAVTGGVDSYLSADLFIDELWEFSENGHVRTDMWGVMSASTGAISAYPIIGFTNYGGAGRFRVYDQHATNGWVDFDTEVSYGDWTSFKMLLTASAIDFYINDSLVYSDTTIGATTQFSAVIMQAFNFGDPTIQDAIARDYTAHWSNTQPVPEPTAFLLLSIGLLGVLGIQRRTR
jgi:hypothetical protein